MNKVIEKQKAIDLRNQGLSYSEILKQVSVAKSTLSLWLREVGLSKQQKQRLIEKKKAAMKRGWERIRSNRLEKSERIKSCAREETSHLIKDPLWLAGTMLYWAEGKKERPWRTGEMVAFSNMDPRMHRIFLDWVRKYISADNEIFTFEIYIHEGADVESARFYWSRELLIPYSKFKVYFKKNKLSVHRKNISKEYFGLLCIRIRQSIDLNRKIAGWIEGVIKYL
jgi:hypothetical protein